MRWLTKPSGERWGYINELKARDASVQWALFMPQVVEEQQKSFRIANFEYKTKPPMRFIGRECNDSTATADARKWIFRR